jgi:hypothetical protein
LSKGDTAAGDGGNVVCSNGYAKVWKDGGTWVRIDVIAWVKDGSCDFGIVRGRSCVFYYKQGSTSVCTS